MSAPDAAGSVSTPTRARSSRCSSAASVVPRRRLIRSGRNVTPGRPGSSGAVSTRPGAIVPPAHSASSWAVRSAPIRASRTSWPFSNRGSPRTGAQALGGPADAHRVEDRGLDDDVRRGVAHLAVRAAHHARDADGPAGSAMRKVSALSVRWT